MLTALLTAAAVVGTASPASAAVVVSSGFKGTCISSMLLYSYSLTNNGTQDVTVETGSSREDGFANLEPSTIPAGRTYTYEAGLPEDTVRTVLAYVLDGDSKTLLLSETVDVECEPDLPLLATPTPIVTGEAAVGATLTADPGPWSPAHVVLSYQWTRDGVIIPGADEGSYTITDDDRGCVLAVEVSGTAPGYIPEVHTSAGVAVPGDFTAAPTPTVSGDRTVGSTLTAEAGSWIPEADSLTYQWHRDYAPIPGADSAEYTLTATDIGAAITVAVTGTRAGLPSVTKSALALPKTLNPATPTISGSGVVGTTLVAEPGTWGPPPVTLSYRWLRDGATISGAVDPTYELTSADGGTAITVEVTGSKTGHGAVTQVSAPLAVGKELTVALPAVWGNPTAGNILKAVPGAWGPSPVTFTYQWFRNGGKLIGATENSYRLTTADAGKVLQVRVTVSKTGYTTKTYSGGQIIPSLAEVAATPPPNAAEVGAVVTKSCGNGANETTVSLTNNEPAAVTFVVVSAREGVHELAEVQVDAGQSDVYSTSFAEDTSTPLLVAVGDGLETQEVLSDTIEVDCVPDVAFEASPTPTATGDGAVGETLTADAGVWLPAGAALSYQWTRDGVDIDGAATSSYNVVESDRGSSIAVRVTGTKRGYVSLAVTSSGIAIPQLLTATPAPTIAGTAAVGATLTATAGAWQPAPVTLSYQWYRGSAAIPDALSPTYVVSATDAGQTISVEVAGTKAGFESTSTRSLPTAKVLSPGTPTVSGTAAVGKTLTASPGTWGLAPVTLAYQWLRNGVAISTATAATYTLTTADAGQPISVRVTGSKSGHTTVVQGSSAVTVGKILAASTPTISGTGAVGETLTASPGAWGPSPVTLTYHWYRSGAAISGATSKTYKLGAADAGKSITVKVTGTRSGYTTLSKISSGKAIQKVVAGPTPGIEGTAKSGYTLTAIRGEWTPAGVSYSYRWYRNGTAISGATAKSYRLTKADAGKSITVKVTGTKSGYTTVGKISAAKIVSPGNTKNCADFSSQAAAQKWFTTYYPAWRDVAKLDGDNDGKACETHRYGS
jgi:hypothetical protein